MGAQIIDGKAVAATIEADVRERVTTRTALGHAAPALHVVLCNDDAGSASYVAGKARACERVGIRSHIHRPALTSTTEELLALVDGLNEDADVDAILVQLPLEPHVDAARVLERVDPDKDVDGFHPLNFGRLAEGTPRILPCTPAGCMELLRHCGIPLRGARAVVLGRSIIVGRPVALLLTNADATVTVCHSRTRDLAAVCQEADIVISAMGRPGMVDAGFIKAGACVIDVGTSRVEGKLRGDIDRASVEPIAGWLTPVPGGVGPMTIAMLMSNTFTAATTRHGGLLERAAS